MPTLKMMPATRTSAAPAKSAAPAGRVLIPDPAGDILLFPLRLEGPLRCREVSPLEKWLWQRQCEVVLSGGAWSEALAAEYRALYHHMLADHATVPQTEGD